MCGARATRTDVSARSVLGALAEAQDARGNRDARYDMHQREDDTEPERRARQPFALPATPFFIVYAGGPHTPPRLRAFIDLATEQLRGVI